VIVKIKFQNPCLLTQTGVLFWALEKPAHRTGSPSMDRSIQGFYRRYPNTSRTLHLIQVHRWCAVYLSARYVPFSHAVSV
ncbi:hypothetical protein, partial [Pseudomonas sp. 24 E 13]|uniref:hypothetical protein n=1 Tax=Pseudomonas sp. 24 E 13 TaxID=1844095 RepID=UPI001C400422